MQDDIIPKIFISYSWTCSDMVLALSERLIGHGVDVVLDKYDLKEGQDKYEFMEQCVNNPDITKVLIISDKSYTEKANKRKNGVGDETVIISSELYGNHKQEKFIPIVAEKDEKGNPYLPTYIKTRIYIDLSNEEIYEAEYEKLLRNIYEKPLYRKPKLGKRPEWIDEEETNLFPLKDLIKQIKGCDNSNKRRSCILRFEEKYIEELKGFYIQNVKPEEAFKNYQKTKGIRDVFLEFIEMISIEEKEYAEVVCDFFEFMYNHLTNITKIREGTHSYIEDDLDVFKVLIWELFILTVTYMRYIKDYYSIHIILIHTYFLDLSGFGGNFEEANYCEFRHHSQIIEDRYKQQTADKNKYTLLGNEICCNREKIPIYSKENIAESDLFLYQIRNALSLTENDNHYWGAYWFPELYVYAERSPEEWRKMKSRKYCETLFELFGVTSLNQLKDAIAKCEPDKKMKYSGSWNYAPAILNSIQIDEIGTVN